MMASKTARAPLELFAAAVALLIPIAFTSGLDANAWAARSIILLFVVAVGLPLLVQQARGPEPFAARCALAFVLVGVVSSVSSQNRTTAVFGLYNQGTGLLFMATLAAAWAIGRSISPDAPRLVGSALLAGALVNVTIAVIAPLVTLPQSLANDVFDSAGRSQALAGNPVHLAALAVLGLALVVPRFAASPFRWAIPVAAIAAAAELSGTRLALLVMLAIVVWALRRHGVAVAAALAVLLIVGLAFGATTDRAGGGSATQRATGLEDWRTRPATWLSARHSVAEHPLLGVGPGQFRTATSPYRPVSVALTDGPDSLFTDAHDLLVEYTVTTGFLGVAALTLWMIAAIRPARGWLLVGALGILAIGLFEPQSVVDTPLLFLALGAAAVSDHSPPRPPSGRLWWAVTAALVAAALAASAVFGVAELDLARAQQNLQVAPAKQADALLPAWPRAASLLAQAYLFQGIVDRNDRGDYRQSREWRVTAIERDDTDPSLWNDLALFDQSQGRSGDAGDEYRMALRLNPTSAAAFDGLSELAEAACDRNQAAMWHQRFLDVSPSPPAGPGGAGSDALPPAPKKCSSSGTT